MKTIKGYINIKEELEIIKLNLNALNLKEEYLKKEESELKKLASALEITLINIETKLKELKGIEKELLYEIVVKGKNVTRAVDVVAFAYDMDVSNIWKNYYPKVKKILQELKLN